MKLIPEASKWHRLWSIRFAILSAGFGAVTTAYIGLPADWLPAIPSVVKFGLAAGAMLTAFGSAGARVVQQQALQSPSDKDAKP